MWSFQASIFTKASKKLLFFSVIFIFFFGFSVRYLYARRGTQELTYDEPYYNDIASQIASGHGFTFPYSAWFTSIPNQPTSVQEPLYPLFLAVIKIFFGAENFAAARIIQAFLGAMIPVVILVFGIRVFGLRNSLFAAIILALYPPLIYFSRLLMTETLYTFFLVTAILLALMQNQMGKMGIFFSGIFFGLACLTRSVLLGFLPFLVIWTWLQNKSKRKGLFNASLIIFGFLFVITPWTMRNFSVHGKFVPISTKAGWNLYFYNYPIKNYQFNDRWSEIPVPDMNGLTEVGREGEFIKLAISSMRDNPALIASFAFFKLIDFWDPFLKEGNRGLFFINLFSYGVFAFLAFISLFLHLRRRTIPPPILLLWLLIGFYVLQAMVFTGGGKARLPIEPMLVLLGSEFLWEVVIQFKNSAMDYRKLLTKTIQSIVQSIH
jgi:4-amino-4-deoxy-L-arabinose transferase-like glycosyltransferase